jgi:catechol 2,3-dioxygenase-like lactoylglutathione lyase family enzyme
VDVLSSRFRLRPSDLDRNRRFYRDVLGLAVYREFGPPDNHGVVFFLPQSAKTATPSHAVPPSCA